MGPLFLATPLPPLRPFHLVKKLLANWVHIGARGTLNYPLSPPTTTYNYITLGLLATLLT